MSGIGGGSRRGASENRPSNVIYEEMVPDFDWIEDPTNHWLGLEVPGFNREEVKLEVNTNGLIKIAGERKISDIKYIWFEQIFQAPENSKPEDCRSGMKEGLFYVRIPKKATQKQPEKVQEKGKNVNDSGEGTTQKIPASTPTKPPRDGDLEKGKKVMNDSGEFPNENEGTIENIPAATPLETPKDEEDSIQEKGKKGNGNGDIPNDCKGTSKEKEYHDAKGEEKASNGGNFLAKVAKRVKQKMRILTQSLLTCFSVSR